MRSARDRAQALQAALRAEGGTVAGLLDAEIPVASSLEDPGPAQLAAAGPRTRARAADYELLIEMILEGSRLHYGAPVVVRTEDRDLALLLGDQLYALGLARLASLGDVVAVAELADVISLVAQAHVAADPSLADAVWQAGAVAVGWGESGEHAAAKALARGGQPGAVEALQGVAAPALRDARLDVDDRLPRALQ
jgi:hypothetical protein